MFIDEVKISIKAGDGGAGAVSFRREKRLPRGGPDGGDAGRGGDVIFIANRGESTLLKYRYKRHFNAENGGSGSGNQRHGKDGKDVTLVVPCGTILKELESGEVICDLTEDGQKYVALRGGRGGKGNAFFKSPTMRAPKFAQPGESSEGREIKLELKLLADVGLVGLPNAGKSTLISRLTAAKPKIADYPFTTLAPVLGVVQADSESFVIADMPGLIEGAHEGRGLGDRFLRHIERTAVICHLIDVSDSDIEKVKREFDTIEKELENFNKELIEKRQFVILTKIDTLAEREVLGEMEKLFEERGFSVIAISSVSGENINKLSPLLLNAVKGARALL